ncbi:MAG: lysophospholipid acyltransferase family protein [Cyanobacteria bacterium P01_G01_bin.54]
MSELAATAQREPALNRVGYHLLKWSVVAPLFRVYFQGQIVGLEQIPTRGSVVVVSNHASNFDPPLLANALQRPVAFMAKAELFKIPVFATAIRLYGAYPVKRQQADRRAIQTALNMGQQGWAIGVFLEGTRTSDGRVHRPKRGAALLAAKLQAPLLPVCLWGTEKIEQGGFPQRTPVTVRIGPPITAPTTTQRDELEQVTRHCAKQINALHALGRVTASIEA